MRVLKKFTHAVPAVLLVAVLAGCSATGASTTTSGGAVEAVAVADTAAATPNQSVEEALADNFAVTSTQDDWDAATEVAVTLTGDSASVDSGAVTVDGSTVTITAAGTYRLSGSLTDGQVVVDSADDGVVRIVLDGADISSSTTSALAVLDAGEVVVVLADGTTNTLSDGTGYATADGATDSTTEEVETPNAALWSSADLTVTGAGSLVVQGNSNDGITGKDGLVIASGTVTVDAVDDGVRGKDYLVVQDAAVTVTAGGDGLTSDADDDDTAGYVYVAGGSVTVTAGDDAVSAQTDVVVGDGSLDLTASAKGLKAGVSVVVGGGTVTVDAADDAVNSNGAVTVSGGTLTLATGDDGVHADADLTVSGGELTVARSTEGLESPVVTISGGTVDVTSSDDGINVTSGSTAGGGMEADADVLLTISGGTVVVDAGGDGLDSNGSAVMTGGDVVVNGPTMNGNGALDVNGTFEISGGTLTAAGSSGMAEAPETDSAQPWISATFDATVAAGTELTLVDADGSTVATVTTVKDVQSWVYSSPDLVDGAQYTVLANGSELATVTEGEHTGGMGGGMGGGPGRRP